VLALAAAAVARRCDVGAEEAFVVLRDVARDAFGRVDIIMNNVGVLGSGLPQDISSHQIVVQEER
jgi:NAD(P)-dependent dehydrogenase (short-subunit alcohol dehydrogenase family)